MNGQDHLNVPLRAEDEIISKARIAFEADIKNLRLFDKYVQLLIKYNHLSLAEKMMSQIFAFEANCPEYQLVVAHLLYKIKKYDEADQRFEQLLSLFPDNYKIRIVYAQTLRKRKQIIKAYKTIQPINIEDLDKQQCVVYNEIKSIFSLVAEKEMRLLDDRDNFAILAMKHAILYFKSQRTKTAKVKQLGKVTLITGTLGPGGAEKQLCLTAIHLNEKQRLHEPIAGIKVTKETDVLINMFDTDEKGFLLPLLEKNHVNLFQVKTMNPRPLEDLSINSPSLLALLNESPSPVRYGLNRLVEYFRKAQTEVAFAWQDGAILFATIAALVAEVPQIILNFRGYPPNLRPHLFKPEYYDFYRSIAEIPNVSFVTNSKATVKAYSEWLKISDKKFTVIYNGIVPPNINPEPEEEMNWANFHAKTLDATETIGGVFRFETDKRPFLAIRFIKRYLQKRPQARFILIGEGRMREQCMELAQELNIAHRILFSGLSKAVGYWMLKMEAMILMSLYEGLPNVLIEAQYMGVPVVTTPAGGARECFIEGETGYSLENIQDPDLNEACHKVFTVINQFKDDPNLRSKATSFASTNFSVSRMIEKTVQTLTGN